MTQIDSSIALNIKPPQFESPVNAMAKILQVQAMQQDQQMGRMKMDEYQRGVESQNRLRSILEGGGDAQALRRGGFLKESMDMEKNAADLKKTGIETEKHLIETNLKKIGLGAQILSTARDQASYDQARMTAQANGLDVSRMPPQFDPAFVQAKLNESMTMKDQLEQKWKAMEYTTPNANARLQADTSTANNQRSVNAQMANANATREVASATRDAARIAADAKNMRDTEMKLADDYRTESKGFAETSTAMKKVLGAIETADKNPGSALAAGTAFMKLLDPNSVVRESELGMALNASGWFDRATNVANTLQHGKIMTAEQKKNLSAAAQTLFEEAKAAQLEVDAAYKNRARGYGVDAGRVITDRGQNKPAPAPKTSEPKKIANDADYNALPSGAVFIGPDGKQRRKP